MEQSTRQRINLMERYIRDVDLCIKEVRELHKASELINGMKKVFILTIISTLFTSFVMYFYITLDGESQGTVKGVMFFVGILLVITYFHYGNSSESKEIRLCMFINFIVLCGNILLYVSNIPFIPIVFVVIAWIDVIFMKFKSEKIMYSISKELEG